MKAGASDRNRQKGAFVLDCSVALAWCFRDERSAPALHILDALVNCRAVVPGLWYCEVINGLLTAERRRRSTSEDTANWLEFLAKLAIGEDETPLRLHWQDVLRLARKHHLSAYDAAYLELAARRRLALATLDKGLQKAAKAAGVALFKGL